MNCRGVSRRLSAYIDDDLSPGIRQGVEEHLQHCISCKRKLTEFEAIVAAAHNLAPMSVTPGFEDKVAEAIHTRRETHEILSGLRFRLTLAGVAFMVTSAAIFFIVGPSTTDLTKSFAGKSPATTQPPDFYAHPETRVQSFPVPEGSESTNLAEEQNRVPADSTRPTEFIMPNALQKVNENTDGKF